MDTVVIRKVKNGYIVNPEESLCQEKMPLNEINVFNQFEDLFEYLSVLFEHKKLPVYDSNDEITDGITPEKDWPRE